MQINLTLGKSFHNERVSLHNSRNRNGEGHLSAVMGLLHFWANVTPQGQLDHSGAVVEEVYRFFA